MADRVFTVTADVAVEPAAAIAFLVDLTRHRGLHPFLQSATVVASGPDWQEWDVVERPSAGPVRYTVRFRARVVRDRPTPSACRCGCDPASSWSRTPSPPAPATAPG